MRTAEVTSGRDGIPLGTLAAVRGGVL